MLIGINARYLNPSRVSGQKPNSRNSHGCLSSLSPLLPTLILSSSSQTDSQWSNVLSLHLTFCLFPVFRKDCRRRIYRDQDDVMVEVLERPRKPKAFCQALPLAPRNECYAWHRSRHRVVLLAVERDNQFP